MWEVEGEEVTEPYLTAAVSFLVGLIVLTILGSVLELVGVWP